MVYIIIAMSSRVIADIFMLFFPLEGIIAANILDGLDMYAFAIAGKSIDYYHEFEKVFDIIHMLFLIPLILSLPFDIRTFILFLFVFRALGILLYYIGYKTIWFVIFPNIFEIYLLFYLFMHRIEKEFDIFDLKLFIAITGLKVLHEVYIHYVHFAPQYKIVEYFKRDNRKR